MEFSKKQLGVIGGSRFFFEFENGWVMLGEKNMIAIKYDLALT